MTWSMRWYSAASTGERDEEEALDGAAKQFLGYWMGPSRELSPTAASSLMIRDVN